MRLNAFQLKLIAMIFMVLDHIATFIPGDIPQWFHWVGRIVSPIFFYFVVEGFYHTRNRIQYMLRLFSWAFVMWGGSLLIQLISGQEHEIHNNIFLSLAMAVVMMYGLEMARKGREKTAIGILIALVAAAGGMFTEASFYGVLMTLIFYYCRNWKWLMGLLYAIVFLGMNLFMGQQFSYDQMFLADPQWMMVFALPFILLYNGERGLNNKFTKYMFYAFYPVHIWIIYIVAGLMK
ncbi:TraX family protein [Paenibacillus guangzhouensis]|uniref:TraX family protein n=1 Tax=Paenibacillus guangzhouensis TaxID=1473112 RepID=UPI0012671694